MRPEYDFSKGERGKFYKPQVMLNLPIYLEPEIAQFVRELAKQNGLPLELLINNWLRKEITFMKEGLKSSL